MTSHARQDYSIESPDGSPPRPRRRQADESLIGFDEDQARVPRIKSTWERQDGEALRPGRFALGCIFAARSRLFYDS